MSERQLFYCLWVGRAAMIEERVAIAIAEGQLVYCLWVGMIELPLLSVI